MESLVAALEVIASERPELLPWLVSVSQHGPAAGAVHQLAQDWGVRTVDLRQVAVKAARDLDRVEKRRTDTWRYPRQVIGEPHLAALHGFAVARRARVSGVVAQRRLERIGRKLGRALDDARQRQRIQAFIAGDDAPTVAVDVEAFLTGGSLTPAL